MSCATPGARPSASAPPRAITTWTVSDSAPAHSAGPVLLAEQPALRAVAVPATDTGGYPTRTWIRRADVVILKLFDEHSPATGPGPIATPLGVRRALALRLADAGPANVAAGLPMYGYLWRANQPARRITYDEARRAAAEANVELLRDPASGSIHAIQPGAWELWVVDDELLRTLRAEVTSLGVDRIALFVKR